MKKRSLYLLPVFAAIVILSFAFRVYFVPDPDASVVVAPFLAYAILAGYFWYRRKGAR